MKKIEKYQFPYLFFTVFTLLLLTLSCSKESDDILAPSSKLTSSEVVIQLLDESGNLLNKEATVIVSRRRPDVNMLVPRQESKTIDGQVRYKIFADTDVRITVLMKGYNPINKDVTLIPDVKKLSITLVPKTGLTVLSYNVKDGFEYQNAVNLERFKVWVRDLDPDIIVFQELVTFTHERFNSFAKSYGHEYSFLLKEDGYPTGLSSKYPINNADRVFLTSDYPPYRVHGYITAETAGLNIFAVHFSSQSNNLVFQEANHVLTQAISKSITSPVLIAGDFNSISPIDERMLGSKMWSASMQKYRPNRIPFDYRTIDLFENSGFKDAVLLHDNSFFKASFPTRKDYYTSDFLGFRLDYVYLSDMLSSTCSFVDILQDTYTNDASDHYPYLLHFDIDR